MDEETQRLEKRRAIVGCALLCLLLALLGIRFWPEPVPENKPIVTVSSVGAPILVTYNGGNFEAASYLARESFTRTSETLLLLGLNLGKTVTTIEAKVSYSFFVPLGTAWEMEVQGDTAIFRSPALKPKLPVAIDTSTLRMHTETGWARFNRDENITALLKSFSPELEKRAPGYLTLVREDARSEIAKFVTRWVVRQHPARTDIKRVEVPFPGERLQDRQGMPH